ncbi:hypothetical protein [Bosea sp. 124]|uniref:hypothetical protein n=1 Tax=Bosea sp. 124 TaxID=2135642 RepID=UPI000D3D3C4E|nr:hypothetical protein [Bosea sp. 124]PTM41544.1 hypothetical protein C8D03_3098 [Bosea sp. 124]
MTDLKAFQVEVTSETDDSHQIFFIAAETGDAAVAALRGHLGLSPGPVFKLQRRLSDTEIDLHQIGPGTIFQYL